MEIKFDKSIYPKIAVLSGLSYFSELITADIYEDDKYIVTKIKSINDNCSDKIIDNLYKYILQISIRHFISEKHKTEREFIIGRALYGSCLEETK